MTGNPYTAAHDRLTAALAGVGVPVHPHDPGTITPPCVVIRPGIPWKTARGHIAHDVVCYATGVDSAAAHLRLGQLLWDVEQAAAVAGFGWGDADTPDYDPTSQTTRSQLTVTLRP
jgi:hypothetical protein